MIQDTIGPTDRFWDDELRKISSSCRIPPNNIKVLPSSSWFTNYHLAPLPSSKPHLVFRPTATPPTTENTDVADNPHHNLTARNKADHGDDITRTLKLRVYPNRRQKTILRQWLGCARLVYNMVVADFRAGRTPMPKQKQYREELQNRKQNQWFFMINVPYNLLDEVLVEALHARAEVQRRNIAGGQRHNMSFRALKDQRQSIAIRHQNCVSPLKFYPRYLH